MGRETVDQMDAKTSAASCNKTAACKRVARGEKASLAQHADAEYFADLAGKCVAGEWFLKKFRAADGQFLNYGRVHITRHVEHFHIGISRHQRFGQTWTANSGHHNVGKEQVNGPLVKLSQLMSLKAVACFEDFIVIFAGASRK